MARTTALLAGLLLLALSAQGCAPSRKYAWGAYDSTLYAHYKNPQNLEAHLERLQEIVQKAEAESPGRVPPGLYAEYGYALYETGRTDEAVASFDKEKAQWPESNVLMEKMIRNARRRQEVGKDASSAAAPGGEAGR